MKTILSLFFIAACLLTILLTSCAVRPVSATVVVKPAHRHARAKPRQVVVVSPAPVVVIRGGRRHHRH